MRLENETAFDRVAVDVAAESLEIGGVPDAVIGESPLPDRAPRLAGEPSLDHLHAAFERGVARRREDDVEVVRHEDKFVEQIVTFSFVGVKDVEEEARHVVHLEDGPFGESAAGDEVSARRREGARGFHRREV